MAVTTHTEPLLKSQPAVEKLNTFSGYTLTVTRHTAPRNTTGQMVVPTQPVQKLSEIMALMTSIPLQHGPGFYRFSVVDTGGTGSDEWMVKLGPDKQEEASPMAVQSYTPSASAQPTGEGVVHLGHGFYYNAELGTLTTPWRGVYNWKQGDPMPTQPTSANPAVPASTPWTSPVTGFPGWGTFPAVDSAPSARERQLEQQVADTQRQIAEQNRQREIDSLRAEMRRQADEANARFEKLIATLTAKPAGPDEETLRLRAEMAEERRRREDMEREAARRDEERRRDEQHRAELATIRESTDRMFRELSSSKQDPMLPLLMNLITSSQSAAADAVKAIQAATMNGTSAAERSTQLLLQQMQGSIMRPSELMQIVATAKGDGAEATRVLVDVMKGAISTQQDVFTRMLDIAGQGERPAWVDIATQAMDKIGMVGQALAERADRQAQQQQQVQYVAPRPVPQQQPRPVVPATATPIPRVIQQPTAAQPAIVSNETGQRPAGTKIDVQTNEFVLADGRRIPVAVVQEHGWKHALTEYVAPQAPVQPQPAAMGGAPAANGQNGVVHAVPAPAAPAKRKRGKKAAAEPEAPPPPAATVRGLSAKELADRDPDEIREAVAPYTDEIMFGSLLQYVQQLRAQTPSAEKVAAYMIQARQYAETRSEFPPAIELLYAQQLEVLVEKLLPAATAAFRAEVVDALEDLLEDERGGGDDDEDDDEGAAAAS
jgi:hypothetical protein